MQRTSPLQEYLKVYDVTTGKLNGQMRAVEERLDALHEFKLDKDAFDKDEAEKRVQITVLQGRTFDQGRGIQSLEAYTERYLPLKIQNMIADTVNSFIGKKEKKKLDE